MNFLKKIKAFKELIKNDNSIILEHRTLDPKEIDNLKLAGSPSDIALILRELGEFTLTKNNCLILRFWKPSTLQESFKKGYSIYIDQVPNVAENLLFFAESGSAELFCYDTNFDPWKIYAFDGLCLSDHHEELYNFLKPENQMDKGDLFNDVFDLFICFFSF